MREPSGNTWRRAKYDVPEPLRPDTMRPNNPRTLILNGVPRNSEVLDVGCATGYLGAYLKTYLACTVDGIEQDPAAAAVAEQSYRKVFVGGADDPLVLDRISAKYDVIICAALLEHVKDPRALLRRLRTMLKPDGRLLVSLPNVAHWTIRWELLRGRWAYTEYGLLDDTHLRFFTAKSGRELLESAGFRVSNLVWSHAGVGPLEKILRVLPVGGYRIRTWLIAKFPGAFAYELIYFAQPD